MSGGGGLPGWVPVRDDLRGQTPYGAPQLDVAVRLNTNENSYPLPEQVTTAIVAAVAAEAAGLNRYPDREFSGLRADLADYLTRGTGEPVAAQQIWAGNGSNEVLQHLFQAFGGPGRTALGFTPAYSMHPLLAGVQATRWVDGRRDAGFGLDPADAAAQVREVGPDLVFLVSPNNPTGTALGLDVVEAVLTAMESRADRAGAGPGARHGGQGLVVVDEAYAEFSRPGTPSALSLLPRHPRLVVTRTMSKAFALAGARLGYLAADPAITDALRLVRLPYHLSAITQAAARAALAHADLLLGTVDAIKVQRDRIVADLPGMGLQPVPSDANFVLFGGLADEKATWRALLDRGVLIRDVGIAHHLRVTAGTESETSAFLDALATSLKEQQ